MWSIPASRGRFANSLTGTRLMGGSIPPCTLLSKSRNRSDTMKRETKELIKSFEVEFARKLAAAKRMYPNESEVVLGRICLKYASLSFAPMSPELVRMDKELGLYL